jgi:hypothetical protein
MLLDVTWCLPLITTAGGTCPTIHLHDIDYPHEVVNCGQ